MYLLLFLVISPISVLSQTLQESGPGLVTTSQQLKLTCTVTGIELTIYGINWVRQAPGKGLEWIGAVWGAGTTNYADSLKRRVTITKDKAKKQAYLQMSNMGAADSGEYYCARHNGGYFDKWGPGIMVTVTSAETSGPSVFPLVPCCDSLSSDQVSIGCMSTGYLPPPVDVQWNSGSITRGIRNFPAVLGKQGTYLSTSLLTIPTSEWTSDKKFVCNINHKPSGVKINKEIKACSSTKPSPPTVEVMQASCGESGSVDLVCLIIGFTPNKINIEWLLNGAPTSIIPSNSTPYKESDGTYGSRSKVSVPKQDWIAGDKYTCKVSHPPSETKTEDTIFKCPVPENVLPKVVLLPPTPKDILISKQAKVVCQVSQVESPEYLTIKWKREDGKKPISFPSEPEIDTFGRYTIKSALKISLSDWMSGQSFTCNVQNNDLPSPIEKTIKKTEVPATDPSVYIFPPPTEELKIHDFVSVPCLIKGFKPKDIYVQWKKNGYVQDEDHYTNSEPMQQDDEETYLIYSTLTIEKSDWNRGAVLTCSAVHSKITEKTIKKSNEYVVWDCSSEDDDDSLWSTAFTFITLFLISFFYSATITLVKVKWFISRVLQLDQHDDQFVTVLDSMTQ